MPYIKQEERDAVLRPTNAGQLNYFVTKLCDTYLTDVGMSYQNLNSIVGALECAKLEFYRRIAVPYEDTKMNDNGDVYKNA